MHKNILCVLTLLVLALITNCFSSVSTNNSAENKDVYSQIKPESKKSDSIHRILAHEISDGNAPGMIAAIISSDSVMAIASAGERKAGSGVAFTINDRVHLGSCTKAMTATMLATLVAEGKLSWDTKLIEAIPELKSKIHGDYHEITLWQLLTHRAGIPKNASDWGAYQQKEIKKRRLAILEDNLKSTATYKKDQFHYSNIGYMANSFFRVLGFISNYYISNKKIRYGT